MRFSSWINRFRTRISNSSFLRRRRDRAIRRAQKQPTWATSLETGRIYAASRPWISGSLRRKLQTAVWHVAQIERLEDKTLLAATIDLTGGALTYTGDAAANDLTVSVSGNVYTFSSTTDTITVNSDDTGTAAGSGTNTVTIGAAAGDVTSIAANLGDSDDTVTVDSVDDTLTIDGQGGTGDTINWNATTTLPALDLTAETINLTGGTVNTGSGAQTYNGMVNLGSNTAISGGDVSFNETINSGVATGGAGPISNNLVISYDAGLDTDGNSTWENLEAATGHNLNLGANITRNASPVTSISGITASYDFPTAGSTNVADFARGTASLETLPGDPSDADATFEVWFKPDSLTGGDQVLFETGGGFNGFSLYILNGDTLRATVSSDNRTPLTGGATAVETSLVGLDSDFIQAVATVQLSAGVSTLRLYVNGVEVTGSPGTDNNITDWSGSDLFAVGGSDSAVGGSGRVNGQTLASNSFAGEIAILRIYEDALSSADVAQNFSSTTGNFDLTINSSGATTFNGVVGGGTALGAVNINSTGSTVTIAAAFNAASLNIDPPDTITVSGPITTSGGAVNLEANNGVTLSGANADITTGGGALTVDADFDNDGTGSFFQLDAGSAVSTSGGAVSITGADLTLRGTMDAGAGTVTLLHSQNGQLMSLGPVDP